MGNWMKNVRQVEPYTPGEQPLQTNIIKLNTNENPYPPAPGVMKAAIELGQHGADSLRKYPDPNVSKLVQTLSAYHGVWPENVFVGVGSDDVLSVAFQTFFNGNRPVLFPDVTYSFYPVWADLYGIKYEEVALDPSFHIHPDDFNIPNGGIVIPNPNAPTGISMSLSDIEKIVGSNADSVVIIDEAYIDFGGQTALPLIEKYDNLLIVRTFSKSRSLAGLRVGYAMGNELLIKAMNDVKFSINSYTMNAPSIQLGIASIKDDAYFRKTINQVRETRDYTAENLKSNNFMVLDSAANFVFARHVRHSAVDIFNELKKARIYVRHFNSVRINNYLRITIGTQEEMERFFKELKVILTDLGSRF
ncbi:MAG: histidinol-phosphate transaminase [Clostridiales bacterium]|nr:histidinol-phosphate transaminase [Clostridiales bacterium]MBS5877168.1 histidinol-phosphate transaminase [Clostridiales bacterium]MDU0938991.1 histidinol-phosphate transaminase [Clostridiales bacterium]MDU1041874.1 histidinol-phosphate transaminase [Clostridiales bacterium]MDU3489498.1 histidinol-phosphate transaminase [Clostridiales bacterium]